MAEYARVRTINEEQSAVSIQAWADYIGTATGGVDPVPALALADIDTVDDFRQIQLLFTVGLPMKYRSSVYRYCAGHVQSIEAGLYPRLVKQQETVPEEALIQIQKDLGRTFGQSQRPHNFEARLKAVLCAYALYDPLVGYCQGPCIVII